MGLIRLITVAAPSGAGKSSFVERICREDQRLQDIITCTTRPMRSGESQGNPYFFLSDREFQDSIDENQFVEWAHVHAHRYGTRRTELEKAWSLNLCAIMDIDVQGVQTFKRQYPDSKSIFILPPSIDELRQRVLKRDRKPPADFELRMQNAAKEMEQAGSFDAQVLNDDFESGFKRFQKIIEHWLLER